MPTRKKLAEVLDEASLDTSRPSRGTRFKNRNRMEIVANLLTIAKTGALKTHLMYRANLSYMMVTDYLKFLQGAELIKETFDPSGTKVFQTTSRGLRYLQVYDSLQSITAISTKKVVENSADLFS